MGLGGVGTRVRFGAAAIAVAVSLVAGCSGSDGGSDEAAGSTTTPEAPEVDHLLATSGETVATLDPAFQSYNIEMVEVTGGQFWQPYDAGEGKVVRPPIDLGSERLRNLAGALGPAYIRVSGTWANSTYFDVDGTSDGDAPNGFDGVLTTDQWSGVGEFAEAVDGNVVTSFASNTGVRDADGVWLDDQARALLEFSIDNDVPLVAAEFYNEPGFNIGVPSGYDLAAFVRDYGAFAAMVDEVMPELQLAGPGSGDDINPLVLDPVIPSPDMLEAIDPPFDIFSYHSYPKVSERCGSEEGPEVGLTPEFLSRLDADRDYYQKLRDTLLPGAPLWITETAQAACGGDRWAAQYLDVIRYVDTLGRFASDDGTVVFHNTLASSDYGLIDEDGFVPRPNYWAAVLWQQLMGPEVLAIETDGSTPDLAVYAQCTPDTEDPSVTYAVVNSSATEDRTVATAAGDAEVYQLTGESLEAETISLNGTVLEAKDDGTPPALVGEPVNGAVTVPAASVAFVVEETDAAACG